MFYRELSHFSTVKMRLRLGIDLFHNDGLVLRIKNSFFFLHILTRSERLIIILATTMKVVNSSLIEFIYDRFL